MLDIICQAFHCTPDEAVKLDPQRTFAVLPARAAMAAKEQHNANVAGMTPDQMELWHELAMLRQEAR